GGGDPRRTDGQPTVLVRPSPWERQERAARTAEHHRRPQMRHARVRAVPEAVARSGPDEGPAGAQFPGLELLLAWHLRDQERQAGVSDLPREAARVGI